HSQGPLHRRLVGRLRAPHHDRREDPRRPHPQSGAIPDRPIDRHASRRDSRGAAHLRQGQLNAGNEIAMKKLVLAVATATLLAGCQTIPVTSSNPNAELSRTGKPALVSFGLQNTDFEYAANKAVQEFLESPFSKKPGGGRWGVPMGEGVNDTTFRIDTASMTSRMKIAMTKTGQFIFTGATGRERTDFVADSRQLSKSRLFDKKTVARSGTVIAPDLEMAGSIRQRTVI